MKTVLIVFVLIFVYTLWKVIFKIKEQRSCPDEKELSDFFNGRMDEISRHRVISHLGVCKKCRKKLTDLTHSSNTGED